MDTATADSTTAEFAPKRAIRAEARPLRTIRRQRRKIKRPLLQRIALTTLFALLAIYGANALILLAFMPHGTPSGIDEYRDAEVELHETVHVGFGPFEVEAAGYVNMTSTDRSFYISDVLHDDHSIWENTAYSHEYFHLIQRDLITEAAGGSPSYLDPIRSFGYYFQLIRLNADLETLMPTPAHDLPMTAGLEGSADCYAQPRGSADAPAHYTGVYIREDLCTPEQVWIVDQMAQGHWPEAPGASVALPAIFVEPGFPSRGTGTLAKAEPGGMLGKKIGKVIFSHRS